MSLFRLLLSLRRTDKQLLVALERIALALEALKPAPVAEPQKKPSAPASVRQITGGGGWQ